MKNKVPFYHILQRVSTAWIVLLIAMAATIWGGLIVKNLEQQQIKRNIFDYRVERIENAIIARIAAYQQVLHSGVGLFAAHPTVTRQEWHNFVSSLQIEKNYPGIQGVGFSKVIAPQDKIQHINEMRSEGGFFANYTLKPEYEREQYTAIIYLEPLDKRNEQAIGYDMFSESIRRQAMERARDSGEAALSGKVTLVQEIDEDVQAGFLIYVPVYREGLPHQTVAERRDALLGYVYSPFRMGDLMHGIFGKQTSSMDLHIYDGNQANSQNLTNLMYDESPEFHTENSYYHSSQFQTINTLEIAGHTWTLQFASMPQFEVSTKTHTANIIFLGGFFASILLFGLTRSFETAHLLEVEQEVNLKLQTEIKARQQVEIELKLLNRDFVTMLENTSDFIYLKDQDSRIRFCSQVMADITGHRRWQDMIGKHDFEIFSKEVAQIYYEEEIPIFLNGTSLLDKIDPYYNKQGNLGWVHTNKWPVFGDDGTTVVGLFGISRDITERRRMESELSDAKKLADDIINGLPGIFYMINTEGNLFRWNTHFSSVTGYSDAEMINRPALDIIATEDKALVATRIEEVFKMGESFVEAGLLRKNGEITPYYFTGQRTTLQDQTYIIGLGQDIAARKRMEQQLWQLANTDFLTGLMNRRYFMDKMQEEFLRVRYHEVPCSCVLMLDLDHFKRINDTYNHAMGDTVLKHFAALMQSSLRQMDIAGRLGGEEFAIMLPCTGIIEAQKCAERLRQLTMDNPIVQNNQQIPITVSIGIAMLKENDTCVDAALIRADNALYCAKKSGRNRVQITAECQN